MALQQLVYASRATFEASTQTQTAEPEVRRILQESQRNNPQRGLVGALYFGDGCFFQCLEGDEAEIDRLLDGLHRDARHRDLKVLRRTPIKQTSFARWTMKYVPVAGDVQLLLRKHGRHRFDPYVFDAPLLDNMIALLQKRPDAPGDGATDIDSAHARPAKSTNASPAALIIAGIALATAIVALVRTF